MSFGILAPLNSEVPRPEKYKRVEDISKAAGLVQDLLHGNRVGICWAARLRADQRQIEINHAFRHDDLSPIRPRVRCATVKVGVLPHLCELELFRQTGRRKTSRCPL